MIPFDIELYQPETIQEALEVHAALRQAKKVPSYFAGGSEVVTEARSSKSRFDTLIDLKGIGETTICDLDGLSFGASLRLNVLTDGCPIPALADTASGVADRTVRNSITLGGNICGHLPYRETALSLLLWAGWVTLASSEGVKEVPIRQAFDKRLILGPGEFLVSVRFPPEARSPAFYRRNTADTRVDYPLVTVVMARDDNGVRCAVGGTFGYPLRDAAAEQILGEYPETDADARSVATRAVDSFSQRIWDDMRGGADYRRGLLINALEDGLRETGETT